MEVSTTTTTTITAPKSLEPDPEDDCHCQHHHHHNRNKSGCGCPPRNETRVAASSHNNIHNSHNNNHFLVLEMEEDEQDNDDNHSGDCGDNVDDTNSSDVLELELQAFALADDDDNVEQEDSLIQDDATASVTDSEDSWWGEDDDASLSSLEAGANSINERRSSCSSSSSSSSCCSVYDDEQDITCIQEASANHTGDRLVRRPKEVRFSTVEIREYAVTIGDHPCVRDSVPMTLDWQYARKHRKDINSYENSRYFVRRSYPQKLSPQERRRRIRETSRLSRSELEEMEADLAAKRLQSSLVSMYEYWGSIDEMQQDADPEGFWHGSTNTLDEQVFTANDNTM
jgi:hypothetical protein